MRRLILAILTLVFALGMNAHSQTARVQVIHNSADAAANVVDVYLDNTLLIDDFSFRTASPFIDAPAGTAFTVGIAPSTSTSSGDAIATFQYTLTAGETYILVAEGIVSESGYTPATPFDIKVFAQGRESAMTSGNTDVLVHHGSTDAPTVDVAEVGVGAGTIVDNASFGDFAGYLELATADYVLSIQDETGNTTVASYQAPLASLNLTDAALVVVASGFLDPSMNSNGPAFGLYVALPSGGDLVQLPSASTADIKALDRSDVRVFPNPVSSQMTISITDDTYNKMYISDIHGRPVLSEKVTGLEITTDISSFPPGQYFVTLTGANDMQRLRISKL